MSYITLSTRSLNSLDYLPKIPPSLKQKKTNSLSKLKSIFKFNVFNKKSTVNVNYDDPVTIKFNMWFDSNCDILLHDYKLYKITQNIRNGLYLTDIEINYINELSHDKLIYVILLQNYCTGVFMQNSMLYER